MATRAPQQDSVEHGRGRFSPWGSITSVLSDPLLRNGHALIVSAASTQLIGVVFWILAAHRYSVTAVGRNNAALSAMAFLGGMAELNLMSTLVRFLPIAGPRSRRLVASVYALSAAIAAVVAVGFLLLVPLVEPSLGFLRANLSVSVWFVLAIVTSAIFVLQDSALTGVRAAPVVPLENATFAVLKLGLVVVLASVVPGTGIFIAWTASMMAAIIPTNLYLFLRALPRHMRSIATTGPLPSLSQIRAYVVPDFTASVLFMASTSLMPLLILRRLGAAANGHYAIAWLIGYAIYLVSLNMGSSLIVETAADQSALRGRSARTITHLAKLIVPAVAVVVIGAPYILSFFGSSYSSSGTTVLRLLALSAIPALVTNTAVCATRAQRRMRVVVGIQAAICVGVFALSAALMGQLGITGVGVAWLVAQTAVAAVLLARPRLWLPAVR